MNIYTIKTNSINKTIGFLFAVTYGFFIVASLQYFYSVGSGDIGSYLKFFNENATAGLENRSIIGDGVFRAGVILLASYLEVEPISVLSALAFLISTVFFTIYAVRIRSTKYLIYLLPLYCMIFFSPIVSNLFASTIRSGIAFTILMISLVYLKGFWKYLFFGLSSFLHLSMAPIIAFYILYQAINYIFRKIGFRSSFLVPMFLLVVSSIALVAFSYEYKFNVTSISSSAIYNILILCLGILMIFTNKKVLRNVYGFICVGLILVYLFGFLIDVSFARYIGFAVVLYLFFLIEKGEVGTIQVFTVGYVPVFFLVALYTISNNF
tara:strand:- start:651 stop:1619 length:969 start_codon:yes stop_codon:yes gene_type:complete